MTEHVNIGQCYQMAGLGDKQNGVNKISVLNVAKTGCYREKEMKLTTTKGTIQELYSFNVQLFTFGRKICGRFFYGEVFFSMRRDNRYIKT